MPHREQSPVPGNAPKASEPKTSLGSSEEKSWDTTQEDCVAVLLLTLLLTGGWKRERGERNGAGRASLRGAPRYLHWVLLG